MVSATFRIETGNGTSYLWLKHNNAGGIKCKTDYCSYETKEKGMQELEDLLKTYVNEFGYDLKSIRKRYCGEHCGSEDLKTFSEIYKEEIKLRGG